MGSSDEILRTEAASEPFIDPVLMVPGGNQIIRSDRFILPVSPVPEVRFGHPSGRSSQGVVRR
jgi:hypothetical protein